MLTKLLQLFENKWYDVYFCSIVPGKHWDFLPEALRPRSGYYIVGPFRRGLRILPPIKKVVDYHWVNTYVRTEYGWREGMDRHPVPSTEDVMRYRIERNNDELA